LPSFPSFYHTLTERLASAHTHDELRNCLEIAVIELGFDCFLLCFRDYDGLSQFRNTRISNFPPTFFTPDLERLGIDADPTFMMSKLRRDAVVWSEALYSQAPQFIAAAQQAGLSVGWGLTAMHQPDQLAFFEVARAKRILTEDEQAEKIHLFRAIADALVHKYNDLNRAAAQQRAKRGQATPNSSCPLSTREREILRCTASGKTAEEVAVKLDLTARTVNFHLTSIMQLLRLPNKTAAVSYAQLHGWLY
jgi:LuxR family transcriptional regulator, quorum-sensing system regulator SolR